MKNGTWDRSIVLRTIQAIAALALTAALTFGLAPSGTAAPAGMPPVSTPAGADGPAQTAYTPASGKGPLVLLVSGQSGPNSYQAIAAEVASLGYFSVLIDGKDVLARNVDGTAVLRQVIDRALKSPNALPGKAAVLGFSLGGGGSLAHAAAMGDHVTMVAVYYPYTAAWSNWDAFTRRWRVPVLVLAAERDRYNNCCVIESMRAMETAARANNARFELVVYAQATHGFNLQTGASGEPAGAYRAEDAADAWRRVAAMLRQHHPVP